MPPLLPSACLSPISIDAYPHASLRAKMVGTILRRILQRHAHDHCRDIVRSTVLVGTLHQMLDALLGSVLLDDGAQLVFADQRMETVGAEYKCITILYLLGCHV